MAKTRLTYKDFETGKIRYTRGKFSGWTKRRGILDIPYAIFQRRTTRLLIPKCLLTDDCRRAISGIVEVVK